MLLRKRQGYPELKSERKLVSPSGIDRSGKGLPSLRNSKTIDSHHSPKKDNNYDKYYIKPILRYRLKDENPKTNPQSYQDETYIYKNLHNEHFWNWVHPLESIQTERKENSMAKKVNLPILEKFKHHLQSRTDKRVPILIDQLLLKKQI